MNFKEKIYVLIIISLIFSCANIIEAKEKKYTTGFSVGFSAWPSDIFNYARIHTFPPDLIRIFTFDKEISLKTYINLSCQYNITPQFGIQGEIGYLKASYSCILGIIKKGATATEYEHHNLPWNIKTLFFNVIYESSKKDTVGIPYGFIGFGLSIISGSKDYRLEIDYSLQPGMKIGAGLRFKPFNNFQLNSQAFVLILDLGIGPWIGWKIETEASGFNFL